MIELTKIKKVEDCDSIEELEANILTHQRYVAEVINIISERLKYQGIIHDYTKREYLEEFWEDTRLRKKNISLEDREWIEKHTTEEHHHLNIKADPKITFLDIIEFIVDCIVTAKSTGEDVDTQNLALDDRILKTAYWNTIQYIDNITIGIENDKPNKQI